MQTVTTSIVEVSAKTPIADVAAQASGNTFVVTRTAPDVYFVLKPREAERLAEELPNETFESALAKARWTPTRTHKELLPSLLGATSVMFMMPHVTLTDKRDRVVVVADDGAPKSVVHHERSSLDDYRQWVVDNCPTNKKDLFSFLKPKSFVGKLDIGKLNVVVIDEKDASNDKVARALTEAQSQWSKHHDAKSLHASLLKLLALVAEEIT